MTYHGKKCVTCDMKATQKGRLVKSLHLCIDS